MSSMAAKMEWCRLILTDEIEATSAEDHGDVQEHAAEAARDLLYKWKQGARARPRPFGGVNTMFFGDLWQLPPPVKTSICSNPEHGVAKPSHRARDMLDFFWAPTKDWGCNGESPYIFDVCKRFDTKREDAEWFRVMVDECREGKLSANLGDGLLAIVCEQAPVQRSPMSRTLQALHRRDGST